MIRSLLILLVFMLLMAVTLPIKPQQVPMQEKQEQALFNPSAVRTAITQKSLSRGTETGVEKRVMRVTSYTAHDKGMRGNGITASGVKAVEGVTIAADPSIPFGTQIYIPALRQAFTVQDRGGMITKGRLDLYMEKREDALEFGAQELEVFIEK